MNKVITQLYVNAQARFEAFINDQRGVTAIEYALIGVAMASLLAYILGDQDSGFLGAIKDTFKAITDAITSVTISKS